MDKFTKEFCDKLLQKSREIEHLSSVEIVPVVTDRSDTYFDFRIQAALVAALCASIGDAAYSALWIQAALVAAVTFAVVFGVLSIPVVLRRFVPAPLVRAAVIDKAEDAFLHEEVFATRSRTGILLFISLFEREVFIMGDKGFSKLIKDEYWQKLGHTLALDFKSKSPGESFMKALDLLLSDVAPHFPAGVEHPNELPDGLRRR